MYEKKTILQGIVNTNQLQNRYSSVCAPKSFSDFLQSQKSQPSKGVHLKMYPYEFQTSYTIF